MRFVEFRNLIKELVMSWHTGAAKRQEWSERLRVTVLHRQGGA